jgi:ABC-type multidrug transport system permease subunit
MSELGTVWSRMIFPMWFMGGFQFSWFAFYKVFPTMAIISLCNPMIYLTEMTRVAISGQEGYINFWLCVLAAIGFAALFMFLALYRLKKKLDYV